MKLTKRKLAILALIANSIIWGAAAPIFKWSLQDVPPFTLAFLRFIFASLIIFPFVLPKIKIWRSDIPKFLLLASMGIFVHIATLFVGLQYTSSITLPIISAATPMFLIIGSMIYLREKPKKKVVVGTLISMLGVLFLVINPLFIPGSHNSLFGNLLFVISSVTVVIYTLSLKKFNLPYPALTVVFWTFVFGSVMFAPLFVAETLAKPIATLDARMIFGVIYGAVFSSAIAYLFYDFGLEYVKGSEIGIFSYLEPIITVIIAVPLLHETVTFDYLIGAMFVFAGVFIAEAKIHHPIHLLSRKPF